ncbi:twin-arginine translocation signal domain-containing protein, partial [bacterium]|nr:twin-arginine translocation signal domain-containing protein [bacterium]
MALERRQFLKGGAALTASTAFGLPARLAHAELSLGDIRIDVVSDGSLTLPGGFIFDPMPQDELLPILKKYRQSHEVLTPPCNVTL